MEKSLHSNEYMTFVSVLRQVRQDLGVTQEGLAMTLEATQTFVSKCERGERRLDVIELRQWCAALGIELEDFAKQLNRALEKSKQRVLLK
ncbi:helix-turn-helix domain-containing protein [Acidovorax sp. Be4]|uniref:Helix-turn-helix domain-containing protein n=1 Tax=Acidovorax bellezanensis TaxID=2976702 RepID=A0ABT2PNF3_9BURK|nr:helix-turn-helix transcriptional regulator [Acidovorax sp. Be4]MCT9811354.1 helix-turn-helix domain-containing protein [Acidovorax sp. Be4]